MAYASYSCSAPEIELDDENKVKSIKHNHTSSIYWHNFSTLSPSDRSESRSLCDRTSTQLKGCISFFKTYQADANLPTNIRAAAAAAVEEDEARLKEIERNKPFRCVIS